MRHWRIYYEDGSVYTDADGTPWDAPRTGVQVIAQTNNKVGWEIVQGGDQYYWEEDRRGWYSCPGWTWTFYDHLVRAQFPLVVFGRMMSDEAYARLCVEIKSKLNPPKTGRLHKERK